MRYKYDNSTLKANDVFGPKYPWWVMRYIKKLMIGRAEGAGMAKHTYDEIFKIATDDARALSTLIGNKYKLSLLVD